MPRLGGRRQGGAQGGATPAAPQLPAAPTAGQHPCRSSCGVVGLENWPSAYCMAAGMRVIADTRLAEVPIGWGLLAAVAAMQSEAHSRGIPHF